MSRSRVTGGVAGLAATVVLVLVVLAVGPSPQGEPGQAAQQALQRERPQERPIAMATNVVGLEVALGLKDQQPTQWDGEVQVSQGRVREIEIQRSGPNAKVDGSRFTASSVRRMKTVVGPILRLNLEAPLTATVTVKTARGEFAVALADLPSGGPRTFLNGQASAERNEAAVRLTGRDTEDDYPALARGSGDTAWLAYVEYVPGKPYVRERVVAGDFDSLVPTGNGDQVRLLPFDGKAWQPGLDVTDAGLRVWRPAVAVDGQGGVVVAWSQLVNDDWEVFFRRYTPPASGAARGQWSDVVRVTTEPGSDFHVVATTDSTGTVWLAWQGWRKDNFEILLAAARTDEHPSRRPRAISFTRANDWSPALAADSRGNIYVAWDTYESGNYKVRVRKIGKETESLHVLTGSARFEARPSVVCDAKDRLWIAYEEGDEQWGKDYANAQFQRIPVEKNPGFALYLNRTIKVRCLVNGSLMQPAGDLEQAFGETLRRNKSVPRLAVDAAGGVWLLLRHHPLADGAGEVWNSYALRYDGKSWSPPRRLAASANLLDNRPALVPFDQGILAVYSGDNRTGIANREQTDLIATVLNPAGPARAPELVAHKDDGAAKVPPVHKDEAADVARLRDYRVEAGGQKLRPLRGEFHRHTEFTAHRDQDGLLEDSWRYALDAASLDWMGNGDHDNGNHHEYMWWLIQKMTDLMHNPPHFVAPYTHERSNPYPNGHRNVMLPRRGIRPLPRGTLEGTAEKGTPDTKTLYAYLKHFGGICASHTSGTNMGTDWRDNDPLVEPIVEIYQGLRHNYEHFGAPRSATADTHIGGYQPAGFVWNALEKGHRFGYQSSSDHVSTHISYAVALATEPSRQALIDAFKKRHCYAATDNILLEVRSGDHLMGDSFDSAKRPTLDIVVHGTAPVAKVHVIRDNKYVYSAEPRSREVKLRYTDMDAPAGKTSYYYVRIEQADGNLAWGSPMWITYKP
jgi:hypothetical protein